MISKIGHEKKPKLSLTKRLTGMCYYRNTPHNISTGQNGQRRPFDVRSLSVTVRFVRNSCVTPPVFTRFVSVNVRWNYKVA